MKMPYAHVDVFSDHVLEGNGLVAVLSDCFLADNLMLRLTQEFKQFETIFMVASEDNRNLNARIFTVDRELPFAGHPLLGGAAVLHKHACQTRDEAAFSVSLTRKTVPIVSKRTEYGYHVQMNQGKPAFLGEIPAADIPWLMQAFSLSMEDLHPTLRPEVVTTGLPYVLLPVRNCLERARIAVTTLETRIAAFGADYVYLIDVDNMEARTWDNLGLMEDTATGSAAGPTCAYLHRHGRILEGEKIIISQGQYGNRPSKLFAHIHQGEVFVAGDVVFFAEGSFAL